MYHEFATDPKVQSMSESMQRRLVMLFCIRCRDGDVSFQEDELAVALGIPFGKEFTETKDLFIRKGFIDDHWTVLHWDKRQYKSDTSADRTRLWRESKKTVTSQDRHGDGIISVSVNTNNSKDKNNTLDTDNETSQDRHGDVTKTKPVKHKHGQFQNVLLTDGELLRLETEYGKDRANEAIEFYSEWSKRKGKTDKEHNLALRKWVFKAVDEEKAKSIGGKNNASRIGLGGSDQNKDYSVPEEYKNGGKW